MIFNWINTDWINTDWINIDWINTDWINIDWINIDWINTDWINTDWQYVPWDWGNFFSGHKIFLAHKNKDPIDDIDFSQFSLDDPLGVWLLTWYIQARDIELEFDTPEVRWWYMPRWRRTLSSFYHLYNNEYRYTIYRYRFFVKHIEKWVHLVFFYINFFIYVCIIGYWFYFIFLKFQKKILIPCIKYFLKFRKNKINLFISFIILIYKFYEKLYYFKQYLHNIDFFQKFNYRLNPFRKIFSFFYFFYNRLKSFLKNASK